MKILKPGLLYIKTVEFVFRQVAEREKHLWLGATRARPQGLETESLELLHQLEGWQMPLDEKTRRRLTGVRSIQNLLECYMLKGVRLDSHMGLWGLISGAYPLHLRHDIPSPEEMLDLQCRGERFVTYLERPEQLNQPVGRFSGAFEFLMHDLEHAHKFFGDPKLYRGQVAFFQLLREALPLFEEWMDDPLFVKDLNYLKSDMNSHTVHLFKYLKAVVLTATLRRGPDDPERLTRLWNEILDRWQAPGDVRLSALNINRPGLETSADQLCVHRFFSGFDRGPHAMKVSSPCPQN